MKVYGAPMSGQQTYGTMHVYKEHVSKGSLSGHPGCGIINIAYHFPDGIQGMLITC